jgi:hypothetical protein
MGLKIQNSASLLCSRIERPWNVKTLLMQFAALAARFTFDV